MMGKHVDHVTVSVIVPIYNQEGTLEKCVDSLVQQDFDSYSIILVDDGSGDKSADICDAYAKKFSNVMVKHVLNGGVARARNIGLELADSDFICFVDSDDYVEKEYISSLVNCIRYHDADLAVTGSYTWYNNKKFKSIDGKDLFLEGKDKIIDCFYGINQKYPSGANWAYLYRNEIIKKNGIKFDENLSLGEDSFFNLLYMIHSDKAYVSYDKRNYNYIVNEKSLSHCMTFSSLMELLSNFDMRSELLIRYQMNRYVRYNNASRCELISTLLGICGQGKKEYIALQAELRKYIGEFMSVNSPLDKKYWKVLMGMLFPRIYTKIYSLVKRNDNELLGKTMLRDFWKKRGRM